MSDAGVYEALFPEKVRDRDVYPDPDWERVHKELAREGVTLKCLHAEYCDEAAAKGEPAMSYDRFCKHYREFTVSKQAVSRVGHKAERITKVGWAGPTVALANPAAGEASKAFPFAARLPFSRMSYVEPTLNMGQDSRLRCHARAFSKREGARRQVFEGQERPLLRPLPAAPYGVCERVCGRKARRSCRVSYKRICSRFRSRRCGSHGQCRLLMGDRLAVSFAASPPPSRRAARSAPPYAPSAPSRPRRTR